MLLIFVQDYSVWHIGRGLYDDLKRRLPHYLSDYKDGKAIISSSLPGGRYSRCFLEVFQPCC